MTPPAEVHHAMALNMLVPVGEVAMLCPAHVPAEGQACTLELSTKADVERHI
eukprot:CAMPEP_0174751232 /NCGR_PEP_ID=MMETSP1094-20130205/99381_1 /TAXON_ID=156173 /ORGANISM="Chrysochromulina brevifilum, Strain UTEX LB 985" /LENGTH=51 /DNA_ID=CAMNT_0015956695 /DNA_START=317 /DNA_END=472 /DNA_ORIENTATION=-